MPTAASIRQVMQTIYLFNCNLKYIKKPIQIIEWVFLLVLKIGLIEFDFG